MILLELYLFKSVYQYDPDLGFKMRANIYGNNQLCFNYRDYPLEKDFNKFRLLVVSDSFNWMGGKEENYKALLEKNFDNHYGQNRLEEINSGYLGIHTAQPTISYVKKVWIIL